ncbi:hypothetical protein [uncultured Draconibacterium sp.]|uniref:hypothetical protein n=1 Tax=uncultured Draconibacterium sp. TaxID=1573823 RepID=UPI0032600D7A
MKITEIKYPILKNISENILQNPNNIISVDEWNLMRQDIQEELKFYKNEELNISYITRPIHEKLLEKKNFIKAKDLLKNVPETKGYIILPEKFKPLRVKDNVDNNLEDFEYDSVLFSFVNQYSYDLLKHGEVDEIATVNLEELDEEEKIERENYLSGRWLTILPIQNGKIKYCLRDSNVSVDEEFCTVHGHESYDAYANILDYVFSYLIFYNFTETDNKIIFGTDSGKQRRIKIENEKFLNETKNEIEIIDTNYFTRIIRTGEFGVSGHFRLQRHGPENSLTKLIYINEFKKNGYTREAKQDLKK